MGKTNKTSQKKTKDTKKTSKKRSIIKNELPVPKHTPDEEKKIVLKCIIMKLSETDALKYLHTMKFKIGKTKFYEIKQIINNERKQRIHNLALENGFADSHLGVIDTYETILEEHWRNYHAESAGLKKSRILNFISETTLYLTNANDETMEIIRTQEEIKKEIGDEVKT